MLERQCCSHDLDDPTMGMSILAYWLPDPMKWSLLSIAGVTLPSIDKDHTDTDDLCGHIRDRDDAGQPKVKHRHSSTGFGGLHPILLERALTG